MPAGNYYARATLTGVDPVSSSYDSVKADKTTIFPLSLRPRDSLGNLRGTVAQQVTDISKQPLVGWEVIAKHKTSNESRHEKTDRQGKYQIKLSDGAWWIHTQPAESSTSTSDEPPTLGATQPVLVNISARRDDEHDITIEQKTETLGPEALHLAIIGVNGAIGDRLPVVQFSANAARPIDGNPEKLSDEQLLDYGLEAEPDWTWFTARPVSPLSDGLSKATAQFLELPAYGVQPSIETRVSSQDAAYFQIIMLAPTTPGSIQGRVLLAGTDPPEFVPNAQVTLSGQQSGSSPPPVSKDDGSFEIKELQSGTWWLTATAEGFESADASPVSVKSNAVSTLGSIKS